MFRVWDVWVNIYQEASNVMIYFFYRVCCYEVLKLDIKCQWEAIFKLLFVLELSGRMNLFYLVGFKKMSMKWVKIENLDFICRNFQWTSIYWFKIMKNDKWWLFSIFLNLLSI